jgi:hypothetical protein
MRQPDLYESGPQPAAIRSLSLELTRLRIDFEALAFAHRLITMPRQVRRHRFAAMRKWDDEPAHCVAQSDVIRRCPLRIPYAATVKTMVRAVPTVAVEVPDRGPCLGAGKGPMS